MKTLSKNFYGAVKTTANQGFSVKRSAKRLKKDLQANGYVIEREDVANTGTVYMLIRKQDDEINTAEVRISNHTKRGEKLKWTCALSYGVFDTLDEINILNTEMLHEVLDFINAE